MARSRMVRPEFFDDEKLSECSVSARLLFISLWVNSDDYGVVKGNPRWLKAQSFPYDDVTVKDVTAWLESLVRIGCIIPFSNSGESYLYIRNWDKYQKVNRPSKTNRNPEPPADIHLENGQLSDDSLSPHESLTDETETETETETELVLCSERSDDLSEQKTILEIPLIKKDGSFKVSQKDISDWQDAYPGTNVVSELKKYREWSKANPSKRKTAGGIRKSINYWLSKAQDACNGPPVKDRCPVNRSDALEEMRRESTGNLKAMAECGNSLAFEVLKERGEAIATV